jgi:hypothetical protein
MLRRRLALMNKEQSRPDWQRRHLEKDVGLLADDTTLIALRRVPGSGFRVPG